jgi:hypothetical protein
MPDLPAHPDASARDAAQPPPDGRPPGVRRLRAVVIAVIVIALLAVMIVLHVTGVVGAGSNG